MYIFRVPAILCIYQSVQPIISNVYEVTCNEVRIVLGGLLFLRECDFHVTVKEANQADKPELLNECKEVNRSVERCYDTTTS